MLDVLTAEDVRRIDAACEARGISTETLMENAGFAVARAARHMLGGTYGKRVVVVCGKGNNAGDGLVAGRHLAAWGAKVTAVLTGDEAAFKGATASNLGRFRPVGRVVALDELTRELSRSDLAIDAIFGVGLSRPPEGPMAEAIKRLSQVDRLRDGRRRVPILSVDVPSGVDSDTGETPGDAHPLFAAGTVTFTGPKPGLLMSRGRGIAGRVKVADIGIPAEITTSETHAHALEATDAGGFGRGLLSHKRNVGTTLVVSGSRAMPGAAALVCGASVHGGAGLTVLAAIEPVCELVVGRVPEVTTIPLPETSEGTIDQKALDLIRARLDEFDAMAIGPGLSRHPPALEAARLLLSETKIPAVVDADAIVAFAGMTEALAARDAATVITPHAGELARLVGSSVADIERDRMRAAREAASMLQCVVLLKGPGTVVAEPKGGGPPVLPPLVAPSPEPSHVWLTPTGGPALAQGGTGDVLTGLIGALWAQRSRSVRGGPDSARSKSQWFWGQQAAIGAWIHGAAGDRAWERYGPHPANASMLIELLPEVIHEVAG